MAPRCIQRREARSALLLCGKLKERVAPFEERHLDGRLSGVAVGARGLEYVFADNFGIELADGHHVIERVRQLRRNFAAARAKAQLHVLLALNFILEA